MGATWVATPNTRQHDAYYQRQYVEGLTRSGTSPNTLEQCQTDWQWLGRVGATLGRGWAMGALPIGHIGFWLAKSNVGVWSCGRQITGVISRLRARDRKSWPRLGNWAVRGPSCKLVTYCWKWINESHTHGPRVLAHLPTHLPTDLPTDLPTRRPGWPGPRLPRPGQNHA